MPLTDTTIRNFKFLGKANRLWDSKGLYLQISKNGGKWWRFKYRFDGKEKLISLGVYPDVSLKDARGRRDDARQLVANGIDPSEHRKQIRAESLTAGKNSFEIIAREWLVKQSTVWAGSTTEKARVRFEQFVFPWLGKKPITKITAPEVLTILRRIEDQGIIETTHRVKALCSRVFKYAVATGRAVRDPTTDLGTDALTPKRVKHRATITDERKIGELLRAIEGYKGNLVTRSALKLAPMLFVRPGELRHAEWGEIDLDAAKWRIPAEKMKKCREHIVPLAKQAVDVLEELQPLTGRGRYVFPSDRTVKRAMSDNAINAALRRMGFGTSEICGHGFRAMASTRLHEMGWESDVIERQLAHLEQNKVKGAYSHAEHLHERERMMQVWADYLDSVREKI